MYNEQEIRKSKYFRAMNGEPTVKTVFYESMQFDSKVAVASIVRFNVKTGVRSVRSYYLPRDGYKSRFMLRGRRIADLMRNDIMRKVNGIWTVAIENGQELEHAVESTLNGVERLERMARGR